MPCRHRAFPTVLASIVDYLLVCSRDAVCLYACIWHVSAWLWVSVCGGVIPCVAVLLRVAVWFSVPQSQRHAAGVGGNSRPAAVAMRRSLSSGCGAVS